MMSITFEKPQAPTNEVIQDEGAVSDSPADDPRLAIYNSAPYQSPLVGRHIGLGRLEARILLDAMEADTSSNN